jgi:hypothetical protein
MIYKTSNFVLQVQVCGDGDQTQEIKLSLIKVKDCSKFQKFKLDYCSLRDTSFLHTFSHTKFDYSFGWVLLN